MKGCVYINDTEVLAYHLVKYSVFETMILIHMLFIKISYLHDHRIRNTKS